MVKQREKNNKKRPGGKGFKTNGADAGIINASTVYEACTEQLSPLGGLLPLIKFFDLVGFKEIFYFAYHRPRRDPKLGHYLMLVGILMLLFIGFNRVSTRRWRRFLATSKAAARGIIQNVGAKRACGPFCVH